jgi:hypothetical protein
MYDRGTPRYDLRHNSHDIGVEKQEEPPAKC